MMEAIVDDVEIANERLAWIEAGEDLQKPVFNRTEAEMSRLMTLLRRLPFFADMNFNDRLFLAKNMTMRRATPGEVLLQVPESHSAEAQPSPTTAAATGGTQSLDSTFQSLNTLGSTATAPVDDDYLRLVESATMEAKARESERTKAAAARQPKRFGVADEPDAPGENPFFIVVFGSVGLQQRFATGRVQTLLDVGDTFGNPLVMNALPPGSAYVAINHVELLCISARTYRERLGRLDDDAVARRIEFLRKLVVPVLSSMPDASLEKLARRLYPMTFQSKELVVREGEPGDSFYLIQKGKMKVVREIDFTQVNGVPTVKLLELATLVEGEYFGELSFLRHNVDANRKSKLPKVGYDIDFLASDDTDDDAESKQLNKNLKPLPRQATVYAHTPCTLLVLPHADFQELIVDSALVRMREYAKGYPTQHDIRTHFTKKQRWEGFKDEVMDRVSRQRHQV